VAALGCDCCGDCIINSNNASGTGAAQSVLFGCVFACPVSRGEGPEHHWKGWDRIVDGIRKPSNA
jgi:hypothetical protein